MSPQAIGIQPGPNGGIVLTTKKANKQQKPSQMYQRVTIPKSTSTRRAFRTVVNSTTKRGYRSDLRAEAVARASRIRESQRPVKADKQRKLRGSKARKAREVKA